MPELDLASREEMLERLDRVLAVSPADATELTWIELRRGRAGTGKRRDGFEGRERTVLVRVRERGRTGFHRTGEVGASELEAAVREALAVARLTPPAPPPPGPAAAGTTPGGPVGADRAGAGPASAGPQPAGRPTGAGTAGAPGSPGGRTAEASLFDAEVARLDAGSVRGLLQRLAGRGEALRLGWVEGRVAVATSGGLRRAVQATAVTAEAGRGGRPGAGRAAGAARSLAALDPAAVMARARGYEGPEEVAGLPPDGSPLLLSPEAAAALLAPLNRLALSSCSFREGTSPLRGRLGEAVFAPAVSLRDDATRPDGLPFPFDLAGVSKRPVDLVTGGVLLTPAVDDLLAAEIGRPTTPHALSPGEALAANLFLLPGERPDEELARELGDGALWIGALDPVECFDPAGLRFRAVARGVRLLGGGAPGRSLPDLVWEDGLLAVLGRVVATGARPLTVAGPEPLLGGICSPALALARAASLRPLTAAGGEE